MPSQPPPTPPDPQRLPFDLASYLLWGPELRKHHHHLLTQMMSLQHAQSTYETRILATEAVAAAASAATEAIRGMQDKIEAMEAVDKERPFDTWAAEQITRICVFVEENRGVRGRLGDVERGVERSLEEVKRGEGTVGVLKELERRLGVLEGQMRRDERVIRGLESEVKRLKMGGTDAVGRVEQVPVAGEGARVNGVSRWKAAREEDEESEATTETEGEEEREQGEGDEEGGGKEKGEVSFAQDVVVIQVPQSPISTDSHEAALTSIPPERQPASSARHRLMKRPSIYNSKVARPQETHQKLPEPEPRKSLQVALKVGFPESRLLEQTNPRERKQPENEAPVPRVTRSQAKAHDETPRQIQDPMKEGSSPIKATKSTDQRQAKQRKPIPESAVGKKRDFQPSQLTSSEASKRRKLNTAVQTSVIPEASVCDKSDLQSTAAELGTSLGRTPLPKIPTTGSSCYVCRQKKRGCDRAKPTCSQCAKQPQFGACQYPETTVQNTQSGITNTYSPRKGHVATNGSTNSREPKSKIAPKVSRPASPQKPVVPRRPIRKEASPTKPTSPAVTRSSRRFMPDITDYDTYMKMKAENRIP